MPKTRSDRITLQFLSSIMGHSEMYIKESDPTKRAELAEQVRELIRKGNIIFLIQGEETRRIKDYDAETNEWVVIATAQEVPAELKGRAARKYGVRLGAGGSTTTVVPPMAGG